MRTLFSALLISALTSSLAFAGDTGKVAIGSGLGGVAGNVIGQQVGGSTGAAIGAGLGGAAGGVITARDGNKTEAALGGGLGAAGGWCSATKWAAALGRSSAQASAARQVVHWPMSMPVVTSATAATPTAKNTRSIKSTNTTEC